LRQFENSGRVAHRNSGIVSFVSHSHPVCTQSAAGRRFGAFLADSDYP
jgi:hypothetical protein